MFTEENYLHTEGRKMVDKSGRAVVLRGTNAGGWLHREGWMDGCGACLVPAKYEILKCEEGCTELELDRTQRINRLTFAGAKEGAFRVEASLDGTSFKTVAEGRFEDVRKAALDNGRPVPYLPDKNTYDEGCFTEDGVIHTNEFGARIIRLISPGQKVEITDAARYGDVDDYSARKILAERFGETEAENLLTAYQESYFTEEDLQTLRSLDMNFLRVPIYWQEIADRNGNIKSGAFRELDWLIGRCRDLEIYVMLDYHGTPGGNTMGSITSGQLDSNDLWTDPEAWEISMRIWKALSDHFKNEPTVAAYDLLNEPTPYPASFGEPVDYTGVALPSEPVLFFGLPDNLRDPVRRFYRDAAAVIRENGDRHVLCMQEFLDPDLAGPLDRETFGDFMVQYHCYPVGDFRNHDMVLRSAKAFLDVILKHETGSDRPALIGEFCMWGFTDIWEMWLKTLKENGISWATWSYKITDPVAMDHWSIFYGPDVEYVDYLKDSPAVIREKWEKFSTANYRKNEELEEVLRKYL